MRAVPLAVLLIAVAGCATDFPVRQAAAPPSKAAIHQEKKAAGAARPYINIPNAEPYIHIPNAASGRYAVARGHAAPPKGHGPVARYLVEVERGLPFEREPFAEQVHRILNDPRGWGRFERVDHGPVQVRVALSSPRLTNYECAPLITGGDLSCWNGSRSVINAVRWARGVPQYRGNLNAYREYVISHEVGHSLGHHHTYCPGRGMRAPVMVQQSKSLGSCRPNPWPHPIEH